MGKERTYPQADIVVLTVLPEEFAAAKQILDDLKALPGSEDEPNTYSWHAGTLRSPLYDSNFTVVVGKGSATNNYAVAATLIALQYFSPRYVVFVGVAGGLQGGKGQLHGDVVVSTLVCAYEYGKVDTAKHPVDASGAPVSGFAPRTDLTTTADLGLSRAADAAIAKKDKWWRDDENPRRAPVAQTGHIASGDKVIDDPTDPFFQAVLKVWPKLLAVEMEGAGVGAAIREAHALGRKVGFALVRGLSDLPHKKEVSGSASTEERDNSKPLASINAARFFAHLVGTLWPTPPRSKALDNEHVADTQRIRNLMGASLGQVPCALGASLHIPRPDTVSALETALAGMAGTGLAVIGSSGAGKSALLRGLVETRLADDTEALWFDAAGLRDTDYLQVEAALGLRRSLREFAHQAVAPLPVVVIDGLDRESDEKVFRVVAALLGVLSDRWRAAIACQSEQWERVQLALLRAGVPANKLLVHQVQTLDASEYSVVERHIPQLAALLRNPRLKFIVSNLKILDVIVSKLLVGENVPAAGWVGESSVALWYWESYVHTGPRAALRGRVASRIAESQVRSSKQPLDTATFAADEMDATESLILDKVLRRRPDGTLVFEHDLIGDWIRFQSIVTSGSVVEFIGSRRALPHWPRAIRLYGMYLLEHRNSVDDWDAARVAISQSHGDSTGDLILESVAFATNPSPLLQQIEPLLLRDQGVLLRRFLNRFLQFCTVPDPEMLEFARAAKIERDDVESAYRFPNWTYWPPVLRFICDKQASLLPFAPTELSRVADLWLKFAPARRLRRRVAEVAIALGKFGLELEESWKDAHRKQRRACYRVALRAARDVPEQATAFARRAAHRELPPEDVIPERSELDDGELVSLPDGPSSRVDEEFRKVVLDDASFQSFVDANPGAAREVALAVLLREPHYRERFDPIEHEHGLTDPRWKTNTFLDGPFLILLRRDFQEGLELIARLVDGSTKRLREYEEQRFQFRGWYGSPTEDEPSPDEKWKADTIRLDLGDTWREYVGGSSAYGWSGGYGHVHNVVQVALTALEKHLYLRSDAGLLSDKILAQILERVESAAFLKVLVNVGKFRPELFDGVLRPLLGDVRLYAWDFAMSRQSFNGLLMFSLDWSETARKLVGEFVRMPHRSNDLRLLARERFESVESTREYLTERFTAWRKELADSLHEFDWVESTIAVIGSDTTHYDVTAGPRGGLQLSRKSAGAVEPDERAAAEAQERLNSLMFPIHARRIFEGAAQQLPHDELWAFIRDRAGGWRSPTHAKGIRASAARLWREIKRRIGLGSEGRDEATFPYERVKVIVPAIALLAEFHSDWLHQDSERVAWCCGFLRQCVDTPSDEDLDPRGPELEAWDEFAADAVAGLWARRPQDEDLRDVVGRLALRPRYVVTKRLVTACSKKREHFRRDVEQLLRTLVVVAQVRPLMRMVLHIARAPMKNAEFDTEEFEDDMANWFDGLRDQFVRGTLAVDLMPWADLDPTQQIASFRVWRDRLARRRPGVDFQLLDAAHAWMPALPEALDDRERDYIKWLWHEAARSMAANRGLDDDDEKSPIPTEGDYWVLGGVGSIVVHLAPEDARTYWEPIFRMGETRGYFAERFLSRMYRYVLAMKVVPATFGAMLATVVDEALAPDGTARVAWSSFESSWLALIGLDEVTRGAWTDAHTQVLSVVEPHIVRWLKRPNIYSRHIATVARFITAPGQSIRAAVLPGLAERASAQPGVLDEERTADALAVLLQTMARELSAEEVRGDMSFQKLLQALLDQQNAIALTLYGKLAS